ncbi:hypothetical protein DFH09DRAFT_1072326 [Mycena vulgaris]|nr:hypothetical protein DFH09DRAFT_1072326 [Mycena vulgaris]
MHSGCGKWFNMMKARNYIRYGSTDITFIFLKHAERQQTCNPGQFVKVSLCSHATQVAGNFPQRLNNIACVICVTPVYSSPRRTHAHDKRRQKYGLWLMFIKCSTFSSQLWVGIWSNSVLACWIPTDWHINTCRRAQVTPRPISYVQPMLRSQVQPPPIAIQSNTFMSSATQYMTYWSPKNYALKKEQIDLYQNLRRYKMHCFQRTDLSTTRPYFCAELRNKLVGSHQRRPAIIISVSKKKLGHLPKTLESLRMSICQMDTRKHGLLVKPRKPAGLHAGERKPLWSKWLAKPTKWLARPKAGRGRVMPRPLPKQANRRGRKPLLQAKK